MSWQALKSNLVEMRVANIHIRQTVHNVSKEDVLVQLASKNENELYCVHFGKGLKLAQKGYRYILQSALAPSLEMVRKIFWKIIDDLQKNQHTYSQVLCQFIKEKKDIEQLNREEASAQILYFCQMFKPFINDILKDKDFEYIPLIFEIADSKYYRKDYVAILKSLFRTIHFFQKIHDIESHLELPLPLKELIKISTCEGLDKKEKEKILFWFNRLKITSAKKIPTFDGEKENHFVKIRYIHRLLVDIVDFANEVLFEKQQASIVSLEGQLYAMGYRGFEEIDLKQIAWRESLYSGGEISLWGKKFILGEILKNDEKDFRKETIFGIKDFPQFELVIYPNEARHNISFFEVESLHCGIFWPKVFGIVEYGQCLVRERLYDSLEDQKWVSFGEVLEEEDKHRSLAISQLLACMANSPYTPYPLKPEFFKFTYNGNLRANFLMIPAEKNFEEEEFFIFLCAHNGNNIHPAVFTFLMHESGYSKKKEAKDYQELIIKAIAQQDPKKCITQEGKIKSQYSLDRRSKFFSDMQQIYLSAVNGIEMQYQVSSEKVKSMVKEVIIETHARHCPGSYLFDQFFMVIYKLAIQRLKPSFKKEFLKKLDNEYKLAAKNIQTLRVWLEDDFYYNKGIVQTNFIDENIKKATIAFRKLGGH